MFFKPLSPGTIRMYLCICCQLSELGNKTKYSATMQQCNTSSMSVIVLFVGSHAKAHYAGHKYCNVEK